jgi:hypothetical protein
LPATVLQLGEAFYEGTDCAPALALALEDSGWPDFAAHFRATSIHPKGCAWLDTVLGKTYTAADLDGILVTLHVGDEQTLFLSLDADGSIQCMGSGDLFHRASAMFIGQASPEVFEWLRGQVTVELLRWVGQHAAPAPRGKVCLLTLGLRRRGGRELLIQWQYGSESQGLPPVIDKFVVAAVQTTDAWFERQKQTLGER